MTRRRSTAVTGALALSAAAVLSTASPVAGAATANRVVTVGLTDASVTGVPATLPAGWYTFAGVSHAKDARGFSLGRLNAGTTAKRVTADSLSASDSAFFSLLKEVTFVGGAGANTGAVQRAATVHLTPGTYAIDSIAVNDGPNATPRYFTVTAGSVGAKPATNASVQMDDFDFDLYHFGPGAKVISFRNPSPQTHEFMLARVQPGHSRSDVLNALQADQPPAWIHDDGFYGLLGPHASMVAKLTVPKGAHYVVVCFLPDISKKSYVPHAAEGMYAFIGF